MTQIDAKDVKAAGLIERLRVWRRSEFGQSPPGMMFEEAADMIESLKAYARHNEGCTAAWIYRGRCTCGLDALIARIEGGV